MKTDITLKEALTRINGKGFKAYKEISGEYRFTNFRLMIDHVQGDPYAAPSRLRVRVPRHASGFPEETTRNRSTTVALCDLLTRRFYNSCKKFARGNRGIGRSGQITIDTPVQEILERSAMIINDQFVEARFFMGLPAFGRKIAAREAQVMLFDELPRIVNHSLFMQAANPQKVYSHIQTAEDADSIRNLLAHRNLVAFVADGTLLPRQSGIDSRPMAREKALLFHAPETLRVAFKLPSGKSITGMGIPEGVTLIVGGGYHGKSTLLNALELGIYNHLPGDGRELVVSLPNTVKIRAADGRSIVKTTISPFIENLPFKENTAAFSTTNASGSTSQAANISEAVECGAQALLLDEDTSATNFMIRDHRMQKLVTKKNEPITPFIDKIRQLYQDLGISTVLVMGGSGDYFSVADHVVHMAKYQPLDVTEKASRVAKEFPSGRTAEGGKRFGRIKDRAPLGNSFDPFRGNNRVKIAAPRPREIQFGKDTIELWDLDQLIDISQTRALGWAIHYATRYMDGHRPLKSVVEQVQKDIDAKGLDILPPWITGDLAGFRKFELAAAINRMRTLEIA